MLIDDLKKVPIGKLLTIDDADVRGLTESEDYKIINVKVYSQEEGEIVFLDLDGFFLIAHTLRGKPLYGIYELNATGDVEDLEDDGFRLLLKDNLPRKIYAKANKEIIYRPTTEVVLEMNVDRQDKDIDKGGEISVCEFRGKTKYLNRILLERLDEDFFNVYQGFNVKSKSIIL